MTTDGSKLAHYVCGDCLRELSLSAGDLLPVCCGPLVFRGDVDAARAEVANHAHDLLLADAYEREANAPETHPSRAVYLRRRAPELRERAAESLAEQSKHPVIGPLLQMIGEAWCGACQGWHARRFYGPITSRPPVEREWIQRERLRRTREKAP